jgi:hypothetical protein
VAVAGDEDEPRAAIEPMHGSIAVASSLPGPDHQARALSVLAQATLDGVSLLPSCVLRMGRWSIPLAALIQFEPDVMERIADELSDLTP